MIYLLFRPVPRDHEGALDEKGTVIGEIVRYKLSILFLFKLILDFTYPTLLLSARH